MEILKKTGRLVYDIDGHQGYSISVATMSTLLKPWSKNRILDNVRVIELAQHLKQNGWVPPIIYTAEIPTEGLVCYDGNHRREAYRKISPSFDKQLVIIDIIKQPLDIYMCFNNINRSVPLAQIDLRMDKDSCKIRQDLDKLMTEYEEDYPLFLSASARCNTPNFNRDHFKDQLFHFIEQNEYQFDVQKLKDALKVLNDTYSKDCRKHSDVKKLRENVARKCRDGGLWLFAWRRDILNEDMEWALNQSSIKDLIEL